MMLGTLIAFLVTSILAQASLNSPCIVGSTPGVCLLGTTCTRAGGSTHRGFCPRDPMHILCCTKTACGTNGDCRFVTSCASGNTVPGLCPGPASFKCCLPESAFRTPCAPQAVNGATIDLIKKFEGFVAEPAPDPIGLPTVGYGHLCQQRNCAEVPFSFPLTQEQATTLLWSDLKTFMKCISESIRIPLDTNQYGALVSWAFNVGCGNVRSSSLVRRLNAGEKPNDVAAQELPRWKSAGGVTLPGLVRRRAAEVKLLQTA